MCEHFAADAGRSTLTTREDAMSKVNVQKIQAPLQAQYFL